MSQSNVDRSYYFTDDDMEMVAAVAKAQATLDFFLRIRAKPPADASDFRVKVKFRVDNGFEQLWVSPFRPTPNGFVGFLDENGHHIKTLRVGQEVRFERDDISDWGYMLHDQGDYRFKNKGHFTTFAVLSREAPDEARAVLEAYGIDRS